MHWFYSLCAFQAVEETSSNGNAIKHKKLSKANNDSFIGIHNLLAAQDWCSKLLLTEIFVEILQKLNFQDRNSSNTQRTLNSDSP